MIVSPDFLDHWKTAMFRDALGGDPLAPTYILRLWAHCQNRKAWEFPNTPAAALRGICRASSHDADLLDRALLASNFIERDGSTLLVPGWAEHNASLIAAWTNGRGGGRPKLTKDGKNNPRVSDGLATGSPTVADGKPTGSPTETQGQPNGEPIREDEMREEKKLPPVAVAPAPPEGDDPPPAAPAPEPPPPAPAPPPRKTRAAAAAKAASDFERPDDIPLGVWSEFLAYRLEMAKGNREAPFTAAAMKGVIRDIRKCGMKGESPEDALYRCMARGWRTPYPEKDMPVRVGSDAPRRMTQHEINSQRGAAFREPLAPKLFGEKHERNQPDIEDVQFRDAVDPESDPYKGF